MSKLLRFICDRMNGAKYGAPEFYWWVSENMPEEDARPILDAIDSGCEHNVKEAIFEHFNRKQLYPLALHYVAAVSWLQDDPERSNALEYSTYVTMHSPYRAVDTADDEYEIEVTCQADARLTLKRQVIAAYQQALRHGHKPWRSVIIELPRNQWNIEFVSIRCQKVDRERVKSTFMEQHEKNRHLPAEERKSATIGGVHLNICAHIDTGKGECENFSVERVVTLDVRHQHITAHPREWYLKNAKE